MEQYAAHAMEQYAAHGMKQYASHGAICIAWSNMQRMEQDRAQSGSEGFEPPVEINPRQLSRLIP